VRPDGHVAFRSAAAARDPGAALEGALGVALGGTAEVRVPAAMGSGGA
jgi:hypothetical protein